METPFGQPSNQPGPASMGPPREENDEITKKKFEKELLLRFQEGLGQLQEGKLEEGVRALLQILKMDELNNCKYVNSDFEKLKAACHINLYRAYAELKQTRKSFYYILKYLDYERDNFALAYEFGCGLLREGFLGAAIVYFKRALSFSQAKAEAQFTEIILQRLVFALCMTDDPTDLKKLLLALEKQQKFRGADMEAYWRSYYTLLTILSAGTGHSRHFSEEIEEWTQSNRQIEAAEREEMERCRAKVQAMNTRIRLESVTLAAERPVPPDPIREVLTFKVSRSVTLNEFLKRINKQIDTYEKPRRSRGLSQSSDPKISSERGKSGNFYGQIQNQIINFPRDQKAWREPVADPSKMVSLSGEVYQRNLAARKEDNLLYIATLLSHLGANVEAMKTEVPLEDLVPNPASSRKETYKSTFYEEILCPTGPGGAVGSGDRAVLDVSCQLLELNFAEKVRIFPGVTQRYIFYGPSLFLREDFKVNAKELMALVTSVATYFPVRLRLDELLVFLECFLAFASPADIRTHIFSIQKMVYLLQKMLEDLPDAYFGSKAQMFVECQMDGYFLIPTKPIDPQRHGQMQIEGAVDPPFQGLAGVFAELYSKHDLNWKPTNWILIDTLTEIIRQNYVDRVEDLWVTVHSDDLTSALLEFNLPKESDAPRCTLLPLSQYWRHPTRIVLTFVNHQEILGRFLDPAALNFNDLEFLLSFVQFDFCQVNAEVADHRSGWKYLKHLLESLLVFLSAQGVWDPKLFDGMIDSLLKVFGVQETTECVLQTVKVEDTKRACEIARDTDFRKVTFRMMVTLMTVNGNLSKELLKLLCRFQLRIFWITEDHLKFLLLYQCLAAHGDSTDIGGPLVAVLQTPTKKIKFLASARACLEQARTHFSSETPGTSGINQNYVGLVLKEVDRFLEYNYSLKIGSLGLYSFFARITRQEEKRIDKVHIDNYRCPPVKPRPLTRGFSLEENKLHKNYAQKVLVEQLLVFILFTDAVNCLRHLDEFFFSIIGNEVKFGESKLFEGKGIRVVPHMDLRLANSVASKIERILKNFEGFPSILTTLKELLVNQRLAGHSVIGQSWTDPDVALKEINFEDNDHLYVFLVLLARFHESSQIEPSQRYEEEVLGTAYRSLSALYHLLDAKYPFEKDDSLHLRQYLIESHSRTHLVASLSSIQPTFQPLPPSLESTEIAEDRCIDALVSFYKVDSQRALAQRAYLLFPDLIQNSILEELVRQKESCLDVLKARSAFLFSKGTKRIDYLLFFYFPSFYMHFADWRDDLIVRRVDRLLDAITNPLADPDYSLNFKSGVDNKNPERTTVVRVLALAKILAAHYQVAFGSCDVRGAQSQMHAAGVTHLLQTVVTLRKSEKDGSVHVIHGLGVPMTQVGSPTHQLTGDQSLPTGDATTRQEPRSPEIEIVESQIPSGLPQTREPTAPLLEYILASDHLSKVIKIYERLAGLLDKRPQTFEDFWAQIFQAIFEFIPRERKNLSSNFHHQLAEIFVVVRRFFPHLHDHFPITQAVSDVFKKFDLSCKDKDFKFFHIDMMITRTFGCYSALVGMEESPPLKQALLQSAVRLLKKVEVRPRNLAALGLLLPLHAHLDETPAKNTMELVQLIWEAKGDLSKMMQPCEEVDAIWKSLLQKCVVAILDLVETKLITVEDQTEVQTFRSAVKSTEPSRFDLEVLYKTAKNVRGFIKRHFEDKGSTVPASAQKA